MSKKIKIIAEIGANHNGDMFLAKEMIWAAAENGADYAKFQSWLEKDIGPGPWDSDDSFFQFKNKREFYRNAELSDKNHYELINECKRAKIAFLTSCFNIDRVDFLGSLNLEVMKVASPDAESRKMINILSERFKYLVCSTGMTRMNKVRELVTQLESFDKPYALLHCVSMYPTPIQKINIARFFNIKNMVGASGEFGISDHSLGTFFPKFAVSNGAKWIEKHFTIDKNIPGPDNFMSINPCELKEIRIFCDNYQKLDKDSISIDMTSEELMLKETIFNRFGDNR